MEGSGSKRNSKLAERISTAQGLFERSVVLKNNHITGAVKLSNRIRAELRFLLKIQSGKLEFKDDHLNSTNLTSLEATINLIEKTENVCGVLQNFQIDPSQKDVHSDDKKTITVDIVRKNGSTWIKVVARNAKALLTTWEGRGEYGERSITDQAERFLHASKSNPCDYLPPKVCFNFCKGVPAALAKQLEKMGVMVEGERLSMQQVDSKEESPEQTEKGSKVFEEPIQTITSVNLDVTALLCLVSNLCHGKNNFVFEVPVLTKQAEDERKSRVLPVIEDFISGKKLFACEMAVRSFTSIVDTVGGPSEKRRSEELLSRVNVVTDQPSERTQKLKNSGKINDRSKVIFGTGDSLKAITVTANTGFVRAAAQSGVRFSVFEHEARALTEIKEKSAKII